MKYYYNFLKKRITRPKEYNYNLYRWLISKCISEKETDDVLASIASWIYRKDNNLFLYLTDVFVFDGDIYIYTNRPGLWIGKAGSVIDGLQHSINHNINGDKIYDYKIMIIEDVSSNVTRLKKWMQFYNNNF